MSGMTRQAFEDHWARLDSEAQANKFSHEALLRLIDSYRALDSSRGMACGIAAPCQRLSKPKDPGLGWHRVEDQAARVMPAADHAVFLVLGEAALPQPRLEAWKALLVVASTTTSTSFVGRTGGAPGSVIQSVTVAPPTKTTSSRSGPSAPAASSSSSM